jgi:hypothetical protein
MSDQGKGVYVVPIEVAPNVSSVQLSAFNAAFNVPTACSNCPHLASLTLNPGAVTNNQPATATVTLSGPAPKTPDDGAVVFLSSDLRSVASVPDQVVVRAGESKVEFPITVYHVHEEAETVAINASYGKQSKTAQLTVSPEGEKPIEVHTNPQGSPKTIPNYLRHQHPRDE